MSAKKHKRKTVKHSQHMKKERATPSLLSRYPRLFLGSGMLLVLIAVLLLTVGYVSDARVGLSMMALFFGVVLVIFANSALPKANKH
ncbi:hypothetical protein GCM10007916_22590 [Psychromonas marina]|uniref:DUF3098 domain-containing protein n=1 Tax=Psychromonas marina TaxID=88364 RepID=A0ABQ6E1V6_9GAMM|nr:hypothetical protein [Psychromonas marina]GLS91190.1 hypothetical protein GCM10007916_22590 [Psychromonas marina]